MTHPVPGHELDAVILRSRLESLRLLLTERAPVGAWHTAVFYCHCWWCDARRIVEDR